MTVLQRIKRAITGAASDQVAGATVGTKVGFEQIEAAERSEFQPEESASDAPEESE